MPAARQRSRGRALLDVDQLSQRARQGIDVPRRHDASRLEPAHDLAEAADVVDDRGDTGPERLEQRPGLVELGAVREDRHGRLGERALELRRAEVPEPPFGAPTGLAAEIVERDPCVTCDEQTGPVDGKRRSNSVAETLVGPDHARCEDRPAVVRPRRIAAEHRVSHDAKLRRVDAEGCERVASPLRVDDDAVEVRE